MALQVVQQQKAECSQKLEGLTMWLAGAASVLANQRAGAESGDVNVLQQKQSELKVRKAPFFTSMSQERR